MLKQSESSHELYLEWLIACPNSNASSLDRLLFIAISSPNSTSSSAHPWLQVVFIKAVPARTLALNVMLDTQATDQRLYSCVMLCIKGEAVMAVLSSAWFRASADSSGSWIVDSTSISSNRSSSSEDSGRSGLAILSARKITLFIIYK